MKKRLLMLILLSYTTSFLAIAQSKMDCAALKNRIEDAFKTTKTTRVAYWSRSRNTYLDYEKDAADSKHFVYKFTGKEYKQFGYIWIKDKVYFAKAEAEWKEKISSNFNYAAWIDSCTSASKVFNLPFNNCDSVRETKITSTPYVVQIVVIGNDSFDIWINKKTDKLERIGGKNNAKDINYEWFFDVDFIIEPLTAEAKDTWGWGFRNFPPSLSYSEDFDGTDPVYLSVDKIPEYKDGLKEMYKYMGMNIKYPANARENGIEGTVYTGFVVEPNGKFSNIQLKRGISPDCNAEALRIVKLLSGQWRGGMHRGQKVRVAYTLPIKFKLE
jgi:TonB family protein